MIDERAQAIRTELLRENKLRIDALEAIKRKFEGTGPKLQEDIGREVAALGKIEDLVNKKLGEETRKLDS